MVERFASLLFTCSHTLYTARSTRVLFTAWYFVHLLVGVTRILVATGVRSHRQVRRILEAHGRSAWEGDVVATRRGILQYLIGSLEDGSVVTWRGSAVSDGFSGRWLCHRDYEVSDWLGL